jgi:tetratricopeptide repeat protein
MAIDVTETTFAQEVVERSRQVPGGALWRTGNSGGEGVPRRAGGERVRRRRAKGESRSARGHSGTEGLGEIEKAGEEDREQLRRAIVGILSEAEPADPLAREYRKRLAAALY